MSNRIKDLGDGEVSRTLRISDLRNRCSTPELRWPASSIADDIVKGQRSTHKSLSYTDRTIDHRFPLKLATAINTHLHLEPNPKTPHRLYGSKSKVW